MSDLSFENFFKKVMKRPGFREAYDSLAPQYEMKRKLLLLRQKRNLTQDVMAERMGTKKSNISRLESAMNAHSPRLDTIEKYANALGYTLKIDLVPLKKTTKSVQSKRTAAAKRPVSVKKSKPIITKERPPKNNTATP